MQSEKQRSRETEKQNINSQSRQCFSIREPDKNREPKQPKQSKQPEQPVKCVCNKFSNDFFDLPPLPSWSNACTNVLAWWSVIIPSSNLTSNSTFKPHFKSWKLTLLWLKTHQTIQRLSKIKLSKNYIDSSNNNKTCFQDKSYLLSAGEPPGRLLQKS